MATTTFSPDHITIAVPEATRRRSTGTGFFARLKSAIIESRMKAAEREIARYRQWHDSLREPNLLLGLPAKDVKNSLPF